MLYGEVDSEGKTRQLMYSRGEERRGEESIATALLSFSDFGYLTVHRKGPCKINNVRGCFLNEFIILVQVVNTQQCTQIQISLLYADMQ